MNHPARVRGVRGALAASAALTMIVVSTATTGVASPGQGDRAGGGHASAGRGPLFELTVLHVNDGESALLPTAADPGAARFVADLQTMQAEAERATTL
ncbi:MAG: hypothetical protein ACLGI3_02425, partial [Actinomycetes bacterium]